MLKGKSIGEIFDIKNNSFTTVGFTMSFLIILYHCYPLYYGASSGKVDFLSSMLNGFNIGALIVPLYFIISGFLITFSIYRTKSTWKYIYKRIKKIVPSLLLCLLLCALILAPLVSELGFFDYIKSTWLYKNYIVDNVLLIKNTVYAIEGVFTNNIYPAAINGSIWTLKHQFLLYIIALVVFKVGFLKKDKKFICLFGVITIFYIASELGFMADVIQIAQNVGLKYNVGVLTEFDQFLKLTFYFFAGVFLNVYRDHIKIAPIYIAASIVAFLFGIYFSKLQYVGMVVFPYLLISLCLLKGKIKVPDISYEIYVFAFPIQQLILFYFQKDIGILSYIVLSMVATFVMALLSKYFFKKVNNVYSYGISLIKK